MDIKAVIAISLGAIGGALSRYWLSLWIANHYGTALPIATLTINLTGCLAMGFFTTMILERGFPSAPEIRLMVTVGFLGSYTTFSTYGLETTLLLRDSQPVLGWLYGLGSCFLGVACIQLGTVIARWW
jgi:fluoride exporter